MILKIVDNSNSIEEIKLIECKSVSYLNAYSFKPSLLCENIEGEKFIENINIPSKVYCMVEGKTVDSFVFHTKLGTDEELVTPKVPAKTQITNSYLD